MSVWVTGDCHGGFQRFTAQNFPQLKGMDRDDYMILAGDFGGVWAGEQADGHNTDNAAPLLAEGAPFCIESEPGRFRSGSVDGG